LEVLNILGQSISKYNKIEKENYQEFKTSNVSAGTYIIKLKTVDGTLSKKVLIN
jgi:hypothetical protein